MKRTREMASLELNEVYKQNVNILQCDKIKDYHLSLANGAINSIIKQCMVANTYTDSYAAIIGFL